MSSSISWTKHINGKPSANTQLLAQTTAENVKTNSDSTIEFLRTRLAKDMAAIHCHSKLVNSVLELSLRAEREN